MGKAQTVKTELGEFVAKELTVGQVRDVMDQLGKGKPHIIDFLFSDENVPASAVSISTGLPLESDEQDSLHSFTTGDMRQIINAVKEANPDFLALAVRLRVALPQVRQEENSTAS